MERIAAGMAERRPPPPLSRDDAWAALGYTPLPKQLEFHDAAEWDVLLGGSAGPGKTTALVLDDLTDCALIPGLRVLAVRRTFDELAESLLKELAKWGFGEALGASWNASNHQLTFGNRSVIRYRYVESPKDATRRQGGEYQKVTIDERTLIHPEAVDLLLERLRSSDPSVPVIGVRSGTNPGGIGHARCKARFVDGTAKGQHVILDAQGHSVRFIASTVGDNPHIDPDYVRVLDAIPDPHRRAAMRDGDWDAFVGQFFSAWRMERHTVEEWEVPDPLAGRAVVGVDWGYANPWAAELCVLDGEGRLWVVDELHATEVGETEQARRILALDELWGVRPTRAADPSMWARRGEQASLADVYSRAGCRITPGVNDRVLGARQVASLLAEAPACPMHRERGWESCPRLHVSRRCEHLVRTLPTLPRAPSNPEDVDTRAEDHAYDALRYAVVALVGLPERAKVRAQLPQRRVPTAG